MGALQLAVQSDPKLSDAWVSLGQIYKAQKKDDDAKRAFTTALQADPQNPDAALGLKGYGVDPKSVAAPAPAPR